LRGFSAAKAQGYFERGLAVARQQQARSWELRAAHERRTPLARPGHVQQARELLAPIYGWFTEGFDTRDLKEAKALLADLGRNPVELEAFSISKDTKLASNKPALCLIDIELNRERALSETSSIRAAKSNFMA
jgi:hypothetical protein